MTQQLTIEDVLKSKVYVNEKGGVNFHSPRQYIEPFLEKFKSINGIQYDVKVSGSVVNKEEDDTVNVAYSRVGVKVTFPDEYRPNKDHSSVVGMVYALDTVKPVMKVYSGEDADACLNLCIFGAQYFHSVEILAGTANVYERAELYIEGIQKQLAEFQKVYEKLNDRQYKGKEIDEIMGHILRASYVNKFIGTNPVLAALKDLENPKSVYAIKEDSTSAWNIYSAMTQYITDKVDIAEKPTKTVMVSNLFHNSF